MKEGWEPDRTLRRSDKQWANLLTFHQCRLQSSAGKTNPSLKGFVGLCPQRKSAGNLNIPQTHATF